MTNPRLEELRAKFQENPRRYFAPYANELRKAGDPAQAIAVCRTHLATQPGHVSGHIVLGQALYEAKEATQARDTFTAALDLDPENLIALRSLGEIAQVHGEFGAAREWYRRLLDADPRNSEVAQLLRDLPEPALKAPPFAPPPPEIAKKPSPATVQAEILAEPAPATPAPTFHTSFTGSGPAYKDAEDEAGHASSSEPAPNADEAGDREGVFVDLEPTAHDDAPAHSDSPYAPPSAAASPVEPHGVDMIDLDAPEFHTAASGSDEPASDESRDFGNVSEARWTAEASIESARLDEAVAHEVQDPVEPWNESEREHAASATAEPSSEFDVPDGEAESPRAVFAERGFDGPADDEAGWRTTPSAAYSDLEAAPEDWFDKISHAPAELPHATEPTAVEASATDTTVDSWFDDVPGATSIEPTEVTSDELWLPPELPQVSQVQDNSRGEGVSAIESEQEPARASTGEEEAVPAAPEVEQTWRPPAAEAESEPSAAHEAVTFEAEPAAPAEPVAQSEIVRSAEAPVVEQAPDEATEFVKPYAADAAPTLPIVDAQAATSDAAAVDTPPPAPFITETLAELYLRQGFRDEALSIYRQLLDRDPSDEGLKSRIAAIEQSDAKEASATPAFTESRAAAQSVRTFFSRLARRQPVPAGDARSSAGSRAEPGAAFGSASSALTNLFSASKPPVPDEGAAAVLGGAFSDPAGRPSRAADRELSLDHLFRNVPPGGPASGETGSGAGKGGGVTLDEFYSNSNPAQGSSTEPASDAGPDEAGGTDIRQFTAWLEGLRKK